jgi:O-antigen ligase
VATVQKHESWGGPQLRSTLWFLAGPAVLAMVISVFHLELPGMALYAIAFGLGLVLFARSLTDPEWLLAIAVIYVPLNKLYVVYILPGVNGTNMVLAMLLFCWALHVLREDRPMFLPLPTAKLVGVWAVLTTASAVTAIANLGMDFILDDQIVELKAWVDQFILFFAFLNLIRDGGMARRVVIYMMLGTLVTMVFGVREALDKQGLSSIEKSRVFGPQNQPNDFGAFLVYSAAPFMAVFVTFMTRVRTWALLPYFALLAKLLIMTFSRGAYIAMALAGLALGYLRGKVFLVACGAAAATLLVAMPQVVPESMVQRMGQTEAAPGEEGDMDASSENRLILWDAAVKMTLESPLIGKGFRTFHRLKGQYTSIPVRESDNHNMFLWISSQMGIPALLLFLVILYRMYRLGARLNRDGTDSLTRAIGMGGGAMVAGVLATNMFGSRMISIDTDGYVWIYLAVLAHLWVELERGANGAEPAGDDARR